jgi:hypothetical protein
VENERVAYTSCPLCDSTEFSFLCTARCSATWREPLEPTMDWMTCGACGHVFTSGYFTPAALEVLHGNTGQQQTVGVDIEQHRNTSARMVERVETVIGLPRCRLWLDVGFGNGSLLMTAQEFGFQPFGIDLRKQNVDDLIGLGIPAYHGSLAGAVSDSALPTPPTVISMADVVEHVPFPREPLRHARALIADGGILLVSMPNANAPVWHHLNALGQNPYWGVVEHYHNFTCERLYEVLLQCGFDPIHYAISERYRSCMEILAQAI